MKREFTGVFIPAHIWTSNLLPAEKMLLGEISALSMKTGWCDASREHFAAWLHCTLPNVSYFIQKLEKEGYLEVVRTPGYRSKMRVKTNAFWVGEVNPIDGGSKPDLQVVVNPIDGGSKRGLPEIQYKEKNKEREKDAPAPAPTPANGGVSFHLEEKEKISLDIPPARAENSAAAPRWQEIPRADTPRELENYLTGFYSQHPHELTYICERTQFQNNTSGIPGAIADFCTWAVGEGWNRRTLQQINARLGRWLRDEKRFNTNTTARGAQPVNAPTVVAPQTQIRYAK